MKLLLAAWLAFWIITLLDSLGDAGEAYVFGVPHFLFGTALLLITAFLGWLAGSR